MTSRCPLLIITAAALVLSACGTDSGTTSSSPVSSHTAQAVSGATINVEGDAPVDVEIRIDRTAILHGNRALANAYKSAALRAADITITRGGTLSVVLFGENSSHSLEIFPSTQIAALKDKGHAARGADNKNYRLRLASALDLAVGLRATEGLDTEELRRLTARPGSDVIRAAAHGLEHVAAGTADHKVVLVLSDGYNDQQDLVLRRLISHTLTEQQIERAAETMLAIANVPDGSTGTQLRIAGIGRTSGVIARRAPTLERLEDVWDRLCQKLPIQDCHAGPAL